MIEGIGLGLRHGIAEATFERATPQIRWLEIHPENYMWRGGRFERLLAEARTRWPVVTHGLSMCFGSTDRFDPGYLRELRAFLHDVNAPWHSDHLCFTAADGVFSHDLLPLPLNRESADTVVDRVREAQDALGLPIALEHISFYDRPPGSVMDEVDYLVEILERSDAKLLLDVNNVYVNAENFGFDARAWIDRIPMDRVVQLHVAGHLVRDDGFRIDTHGEAICEEVYELLEHTLQRLGRPIPVLLERDGNYPHFDELLAEVQRLDTIYRRCIEAKASDAAEVAR